MTKVERLTEILNNLPTNIYVEIEDNYARVEMNDKIAHLDLDGITGDGDIDDEYLSDNQLIELLMEAIEEDIWNSLQEQARDASADINYHLRNRMVFKGEQELFDNVVDALRDDVVNQLKHFQKENGTYGTKDGDILFSRILGGINAGLDTIVYPH